jgi:hypothetical protein
VEITWRPSPTTMAFTLRPLVEVLRIQYVPLRYDFHTSLPVL